MKVTAQEEYGLRCLVQLARGWETRKPLTTVEMAEAESLSVAFVGRILGVLKSGGLVMAVSGGRKGYQLSRPPSAIMLDEVLSVLGGRLFSGAYCDEHTGKREDCVHATGCNIRPVWGALELYVSAVLKRISLSELLGSEEEIRAVCGRSVQACAQDLSEQTALSGGAPAPK